MIALSLCSGNTGRLTPEYKLTLDEALCSFGEIFHVQLRGEKIVRRVLSRMETKTRVCFRIASTELHATMEGWQERLSSIGITNEDLRKHFILTVQSKAVV